MKFNPPKIEHLDDIISGIGDSQEFMVMRKEECYVVDYLFVHPDTFDNTIKLECRGIKFHPKTKEIVARPLHKFFNLGERPSTAFDTVNKMIGEQHAILDKLDGSMIHPLIHPETDEVIFCTRKGNTDIAKMAEKEFLKGDTDKSRKLINFCYDYLKAGLTPIFEFCSPNNRIVLEYKVPILYLLDIRENVSGKYLHDSNIRKIAEKNELALVGGWFNQIGNFELWVENLRKDKNKEGCVIRFHNDGWRFKIKTDDYVMKHQVKARIASERKLLRLVVEQKLDDIYPMLGEKDKKLLGNYSFNVTNSLIGTAKGIKGLVDKWGDMERKDFAIKHASKYSGPIKSALFRVRDGEESLEVIKQIVLDGTKNNKKFKDILCMIGNYRWVYSGENYDV